MGKANKVPSVEVLQNKGAPVTLKPDDNGDARPTLWVRFDANVMADLEVKYDGLEGLEVALEVRTFDTVRFVLALVHANNQGADEPDVRAMGRMLDPTQADAYASAIGAALALATGVDPTQARELLEMGVQLAGEVAEVRTSEVAKMIAEAKANADKQLADMRTPGANGGGSGSPSDEPPTSSGD